MSLTASLSFLISFVITPYTKPGTKNTSIIIKIILEINGDPMMPPSSPLSGDEGNTTRAKTNKTVIIAATFDHLKARFSTLFISSSG